MNVDFITEPVTTVLVVDDNARYRTMLLRFTSALGFTFLEAEDGLDALDRLEGHPGITLVLSDLQMPRMDGETLLGHIMARWPEKAVIMISEADDLNLAVK
jgi:Response regulator containing CheY-like receiver, AAA-type ATPase, and DNA-binding domains